MPREQKPRSPGCEPSHSITWWWVEGVKTTILRHLAQAQSPFLITVKVLVIQSCLTLCDPMDYHLPGSSVHGLLQARILEWVAIPFSRRPFWQRDLTQVLPISGRFFTIWALFLAQSLDMYSEAPSREHRTKGQQQTKVSSQVCDFLFPSVEWL